MREGPQLFCITSPTQNTDNQYACTVRSLQIVAGVTHSHHTRRVGATGPLHGFENQVQSYPVIYGGMLACFRCDFEVLPKA